MVAVCAALLLGAAPTAVLTAETERVLFGMHAVSSISVVTVDVLRACPNSGVYRGRNPTQCERDTKFSSDSSRQHKLLGYLLGNQRNGADRGIKVELSRLVLTESGASTAKEGKC